MRTRPYSLGSRAPRLDVSAGISRSTSHTQALPSVQQPVTVPQRTQPDTPPQAGQSATVARPDLPPPQPTPTPYQPAPLCLSAPPSRPPQQWQAIDVPHLPRCQRV